MLFRRNGSSLSKCALFVSLLSTGCATTKYSLDFSQSELHLIPARSLQRIVSAHPADEIVAVKVDGHGEPVEVKEFKNRVSATVFGADGKVEEISFSEITALLISKKQKAPDNGDHQKNSSATTVSSGISEAMIYAPMVPLAIVTWPLLRAMGLDESKNSRDNAKARLIYHGMSRSDLLESIGAPKEKYFCLLKLHLKEKPQVAQEIWVFDDSQVLRGGRSLFIDVGTGTVSHNSVNTTFFKGSDSFTCSPLTTP